jgi:hypothetical protein
MESHPEEFYGECDKWKFIYKDYFRDAMTETEKGKIFDRIKEIRKQEFDLKVMQTLFPKEEQEEGEDWTPFSAKPKPEGGTVTYDTKNRYSWKKAK